MSTRKRENEESTPAKRSKNEDGASGKPMTVADGGDNESAKDKNGGASGEASGQEQGHQGLSLQCEQDVGITEYISKQAGISGVIKQRYSDFIVNEINLDNEVVHLTNKEELPDTTETSEEADAMDTTSADNKEPILPEEFVMELNFVLKGWSETASIPAGEDKEYRKQLHRAIKTAFPMLETRTTEKDGQKFITALPKGKARDKRNQQNWPSGKEGFPYCKFVMYKENMGTMDVIQLMAKYLKVKVGLFQFAGTKDKRGKTTQQVTAFKILPKRLKDLNKFLRNIHLGNFSYAPNKISIGDLKGNSFTIVLRNLVGEAEDIEKGLNSLKEVGFINYFGLQRFGTMSVPTHKIGREILLENYQAAVDLVITGEQGEGLGYRKVWSSTKNAQQALNALQSRHHIERNVLASLAKRPGDYCGALGAIPRNMRMLYGHGYQSFVWNTVVSRRIKQFGLRPILGDLVLPSGVAIAHGQLDEVGEKEEFPGEGRDPSERVKPIVLTKDNIAQYTMYDVVMPLPGYDVIYPDNEVKDWYKDYLEKDGLDINNMRHKNKDYSLSGGYRVMIQRPKEMEWKMFNYDDPKVSLTLSDLDNLQGLPEPESVEGGALKALRLKFHLGTSCYATMALRELLKIDTSPAQQAALNVTGS